jgi:hypothetical protein
VFASKIALISYSTESTPRICGTDIEILHPVDERSWKVFIVYETMTSGNAQCINNLRRQNSEMLDDTRGRFSVFVPNALDDLNVLISLTATFC